MILKQNVLYLNFLKINAITNNTWEAGAAQACWFHPLLQLGISKSLLKGKTA